MTAWSRKTWKFCEQFLRFFVKTIRYGKVFKILFVKFSLPQRSTLLCWNFVKNLPDRNRRNRVLFTWQINFACLSNCRYCADRARNLTRPANNVLTVLQTSSKSVHFRWSYSRTREHRFLPRRVFSMIHPKLRHITPGTQDRKVFNSKKRP